MVLKNSSDRHGASKHRPQSREGVLRTIAAFKLVKALLLIGVALGSLNLLNPATADTADRWASTLSWRFGPRAASAVQERLSSLQPSELKVAGISVSLRRLVCRRRGRLVDVKTVGGISDDHCDIVVRAVRGI